MAAFFCMLIPPRPAFAQDMTPHEAKLMQDHAGYWTQEMIKNRWSCSALGGYGIGVVEFPDEAAVLAFTGSDPVISAQAGFRYEVLPMPMGALHRGSVLGDSPSDV